MNDYVMNELLAQGPLTCTFRAFHNPTHRTVLLDRLRPEAATPEVVENFFQDIRAKTAVDHPAIAAVYEAVRDPDGAHFYSRELLPGWSLDELLDADAKLSPLELTRVLTQVAKAQIYFEESGLATVPLAPEHVFVKPEGATRLVNIVVAGFRLADPPQEDFQMLGCVLEDLLDIKKPGAADLQNLLDVMTELDRRPPLTWQEILPRAEALEERLAAPPAAAFPVA